MLGAAAGRGEGWARVTAMSVRLSRDEAWSLLTEWVASESLRRHCLAVEAAMRACARAGGHDEELWGVVGLLHDMDYERHPDLETGHPRMAIAELESRGVDPVITRAIASHADFMGVSRDSELEKTLFAVDELSGFILACVGSAVGMANNRNPIAVFIPCHRVIGADGKMVGYGGGVDIKIALLQREGWL